MCFKRRWMFIANDSGGILYSKCIVCLQQKRGVVTYMHVVKSFDHGLPEDVN